MTRVYAPSSSPLPSTSRRTAPSIAVVAFALVVLGVLALQTWRFAGRNYRDDEIRTVHAGLTLSPVAVIQWMSVDIHPPLWRVMATSWVSFVGPNEELTRFLSTVVTALALAVLFRLALDLFDARVALFSVLILGTHALFIYYSHELRPYSALILWTTALHLVWLRWLRRPASRHSFAYALLYVAVGAAALYTHFFAGYVIAAQAITLFIIVRPGRGRYVRALALVALAGVAFAGWLPSFLHSFLVTKPGGVDYGIGAEQRSLSSLYSLLQMKPLGIGNFLVALALLLPLRAVAGASPHRYDERRTFRFGAAWRTWYFVIVAAVILAAALLTSPYVDVLTRRNLVVVLPPIAILAALGLRLLPWQASVIGALLIVGPALAEFVDYERVEPYREVAAAIVPEYAAHEPIILSVDDGTGAYFAFAYYLMDRMPERLTQDDMLYLTLGEPRVNLPEPVERVTVDDSPESLAAFEALTANADRVWWVTSALEPDHAAAFRRQLEQAFSLQSTTPIPWRGGTADHYRVDLYQRR